MTKIKEDRIKTIININARGRIVIWAYIADKDRNYMR